MTETYCCAMRRHFLFGIVAARSDEPVPIDIVDFTTPEQPMTIRIKHCPFCGVQIDMKQTVRTLTPDTDGNSED